MIYDAIIPRSVTLYFDAIRPVQHPAGSPRRVVPEATVTGLDSLHTPLFCVAR
jgi:hypothetical protein